MRCAGTYHSFCAKCGKWTITGGWDSEGSPYCLDCYELLPTHVVM